MNDNTTPQTPPQPVASPYPSHPPVASPYSPQSAAVPYGYPSPQQPGPVPYPYPYPQQERLGDNAGIRMLLPVGRSGWAIAAGYIGLISVLVVPAPFAILFGVLAIVDIRKHPDRHGLGRAWFGIVMGGLVLMLLFIVLLISYSK